MDKKIKVGVLGATGSVGQKFITLLNNHPYFEVEEIAASDKSAGKKYKDVVNWIEDAEMPKKIADKVIKLCDDKFNSKLLFSALDASVAGEIEENLANKGHIIISNAKNHRWSYAVPLIIPEVNHEHLNLIKYQKYNNGAIVTNPNCSTIGLILSIAPLHNKFGVKSINVVTLQAISGAGYPGVPSLDMIDNIIPFIGGEEDKLESEPLKILGRMDEDKIINADIKISASTNRVFVKDGHTEIVQLSFINKPTKEEILKTWEEYKSLPQEMNLPFAPVTPIKYFDNEKYPQPRLHKSIDKGMAAITGRLRECNLFDYKYVVLSHNTIRGAAGGTILIAEIMYKKRMI
ncbi:MAG TPA: aspartate-semialdehyde dehydrogenase [Melioribacteraceae bacterium]|nr:aspartate-semialdehyde dehydrogenase [Melioribacteraceae bacterium]